MITAVLLASALQNDAVVAELCRQADYVIAADGGADHAARLGLSLDCLAGDFDSISPDVLQFFKDDGAVIHQVPAQKNETDAELVLRLAKEEVARRGDKENTLLVAGATGGRLDHEFGNLFHLSLFAAEGFDVRITDGETLVVLLQGPCSTVITWPPDRDDKRRAWYVSTVALKDDVHGLTYDGLSYRLTNSTLPYGSTRGVSNQTTDPSDVRFKVSFRAGLLSVIVTPHR